MHKFNNVITMGCRLNSWESNKINSFIKDDKKNDVMIFNSCCVTNDAVKSLKKNIKLFHKSNPDVKIVVTGCAVESERHNIENMEEVSYIVKNKDKLLRKNWESLQENISIKNKINLEFKNLHRETPSNSNIRKFVKIQNGCDHSCTFCIIPSCRGKSISESVKKINNEISYSLDKGVKEIILTGVDLTSWQSANNKHFGLGYLLEKIFEKNISSFRLRLSSIDAAELDNKFFKLIKNEPRLMPHFHFSLQSLDDMILKRMKRRHNVKQIIELLNEIRNICENVTFGADFICGFPTETEEMFMNTYALVKKLQITHLHVFPYSAKAGTPASKMPQVILEERRKRAKALRELGDKNYLNNLQKQIFRPQKVLVETNNGIGKTENNFKMKIPNAKKGDIVSIKPNDIKDNYLIVN